MRDWGDSAVDNQRSVALAFLDDVARIGSLIGVTIGIFTKTVIQGVGFATGVLIVADLAGLMP